MLSEHYHIQICILNVASGIVNCFADDVTTGPRCFLRYMNGDNALLSHYDLIMSGGPGPASPVFRCDDESSMQAVRELCDCVTPRHLRKLDLDVPGKVFEGTLVLRIRSVGSLMLLPRQVATVGQ